MAIDEENKREGELQEKGKHDRETGDEHQIRSKRKAGVFFGLTPSSDVLWDAELEKKVDGGKAGVHKNGLVHRNGKRGVLRRVRGRGGRTDTRRNRRVTREKDWNTLPDIWMTLGKQV